MIGAVMGNKKLRPSGKDAKLYWFKNEITRIFTSDGCHPVFSDYLEHARDRTVVFGMEGINANTITFDKLAELSKLLGTRKINFEGRTEDYSYSEYTGGTEEKCRIRCGDVCFPVVSYKENENGSQGTVSRFGQEE